MEIKSLGQYVKVIKGICFPVDYAVSPKVFFRGEADSINWKQEASLFRGKFETDSYVANVNYSLEKDLIDAAKTYYPQEFENCHNAISRLVKMQHYGLPTRLYDVTANPLVALYFACNSEPEIDGKVMYTKAITWSIEDANIMAGLAEKIESYENVIDIEKVYSYCKAFRIGHIYERYI